MIHLHYLLEATGGMLLLQGQSDTFEGFSADTRQLVPGEMFVAVHGERGNGHDYLLDASNRGATGLLVETTTFSALAEQVQMAIAQAGVVVVSVENTRVALQKYARFILAQWRPTVIALAGSVGKTSTKEAIATVLSSRFPTFRSWQNYNDLLGIPLSLGRLEESHTHAVLELGCDHPGEIAELCALVRPSIGVLTAINPVQLQYFGSLDRLANELGTLLTSLPNDGHFFYNAQDETVHVLVDTYKKRRTGDNPGVTLHPLAVAPSSIAPRETASQVIAEVKRVSWAGTEVILQLRTEEDEARDASTVLSNVIAPFEDQTRNEPWHNTTHVPDRAEHTLKSSLLGNHFLTTMLAAYQIARHCGMSLREIKEALAGVGPLSGRLYPLDGTRSARLLDDTHNAAPASVIAGLHTLNTLTTAPALRIAVLGEMLNLGSYEEEAYRLVGKYAAHCVDYLIIRGERATLLAEAAQEHGLARSRIVLTATHEDAAQAVRAILDEANEGDQKRLHASEVTDKVQHVVLLKGSEETRMERVTELLLACPWEAPEKLVRQTPGWKKTVFRHADRPTWVEIDLNAIASNVRHIQARVGPHVKVLVALKADAYGHGAIKVARTVLHNGADMLGVATLSEALPLREANITAPILVFGYIAPWQMREAIRLQTRVTLYTLEAAERLARAAQDLAQTVKVHVKVDTGMGRLGIRYEQLDEILALLHTIRGLAGLELEGLYTHFAQADNADQTHVRLQLARFQQVLARVDEKGLRPPLVHAANSAGTLAVPESHFDMVRPGIAVYGLDPSEAVCLPEGFRPALSFKTQISQVKWVPKGEGISYGSTYITTRPTRIAVLPVGYADGFRRAPTTWGSVLLHGQEAPLLGRVCMDQCMIDVTHIPQARIGDEVVLIGRQGEALLSAERVAQRLGTINYEVVSEILARVPRVD